MIAANDMIAMSIMMTTIKMTAIIDILIMIMTIVLVIHSMIDDDNK